MKALCQHIGIPFENILMLETLSREKNISLSDTGKSLHGTSKQRALDVKTKFLGQLDVCLIEHLFKDLITDLGYPLRSNKVLRLLGILIPSKKQFIYIVKNISKIYHSEILSTESPHLHLQTPNFLKGAFKIMIILFLLIRAPFSGIILRNKFIIRRKKKPYKLFFIRPD